MSDPKHRIQRILTLIPFLRKNPGVRLEDLATYCGAPASEILADLDKILLCGVPPYLPDDYIGVYVEDGRVEIRFAEHFRRPVRFTLQEALALKLALESLPHGEAKKSLLGKIAKAIGARDLEARLAVARPRNEEVLSAVMPAIAERRELEIDYYSATSDEMRTRVVRPYGIVQKSGEHYLVGYCERAKEVRSFRVDRIRSARALDRTFSIPEDWSIERFEKREMNFPRRAEITARVRFSRAVARWVREARKGEPIEETPSGDLIVTIRALSLPWLLNEVLGYGLNAEILGPPEVRRAMREHLAELRAAHAAAPR
jgi:proteasome accessory factor C